MNSNRSCIKISVFFGFIERLYACDVRRVFFAMCCVTCSARVCSKANRFFCCFVFILCCWFVYVDKGIIAVGEVQATANAFWYWVVHFFDIIFCEDFFYSTAEPAGRYSSCLWVDGDEFSTNLAVRTFVTDGEYTFFLFYCVFDDRICEVCLFFSCNFAGYFHYISLTVLFCDVGLVEPNGADFLGTCIQGCFSYHYSFFTASAAHVDFLYCADEGYFLPFY